MVFRCLYFIASNDEKYCTKKIKIYVIEVRDYTYQYLDQMNSINLHTVSNNLKLSNFTQSFPILITYNQIQIKD